MIKKLKLKRCKYCRGKGKVPYGTVIGREIGTIMGDCVACSGKGSRPS